MIADDRQPIMAYSKDRTFKVSKVRSLPGWPARDIPWGRLEKRRTRSPSGNTFREMAQGVSNYSHRFTSCAMRCRGDCGSTPSRSATDGRNRTGAVGLLLSKNRPQPARSNSKYIFGPSVWTRGLYQNRAPGCASRLYRLGATQEFGIAADVLAMGRKCGGPISAGDPYTTFGIQSKQIECRSRRPRETHPPANDQLLKPVCSVFNTGWSIDALATGEWSSQGSVAREISVQHRDTYREILSVPTDAAVDVGLLGMPPLPPCFGWKI